jgi:lipoprotein NlpD
VATTQSRADKVPAYRVPIYHVVRAGETLYSIAWHYRLDYRRVATLNGIGPPYVIRKGQRLSLQQVPAKPAARVAADKTAPAVAAITPLPATTRPAARSQSPSRQPRAKTSPAAPAKTQKRPASETKKVRPSATKTGEAPATRKTGAVRWQWPTKGSVVSTFVKGDKSRNGLDISGSFGQPVAAAADGEVVYSGSGLIGYGNLVIVKHNTALLSAYGHNRVVRVVEGDRVRRGQGIAEMGRRPGGDPLLHFEIRRDGRPVNPLSFLPPQ